MESIAGETLNNTTTPTKDATFSRRLENAVGVATLAASLAFAPQLLAQESTNSVIVTRSRVASGDTSRLQHLMARASRGERVTIGVIGGSITQGAKASAPERRYGNVVAQWWRDHFPMAEIKFVNAGIGATGSDYGALRLSRDLLAASPDFIVIEYAVNDPNVQASAETLEGVVRQILKRPNKPAIVLLFMMDRSGHNAQEWHSKVGAHYDLPMVSYRDALWPEIEAKRLRWEDISPDEVHPNDRGMADAAGFVIASLQTVMENLTGTPAAMTRKPLPGPRFTDIFEHTRLMEADELKPVKNQNWIYDAKTQAWFSEQPGSSIEFEIEGTTIFTMHHVIKAAMGRVRVTVDGGSERVLDGWFDQTWGGYRQSNRIAQGLKTGRHRISFELLNEKSAGSAGHRFEIMGIGSAGLPE